MMNICKLCLIVAIGYFAVHVSANLDVKTDPEQQVIPSNKPAMFDCLVNGASGKVNIIWTKDATSEWPRDNSPDQIRMLSNNSLYIRNVKRRYTGKYKCIVTSSDGEQVYSTSELTVAYLEKMEKLESEVRQFTGNEAMIPCKKPDGIPEPVLAWFLESDSSPIPQKLDISASSQEYRSSGWNLQILNVQKIHNGTFTCQAENLAKKRNQTTKLFVVVSGGVKVTPKDLRVVEGNSATFKCRSVAIPPLPVAWVRKKKVCENTVCRDQLEQIPSNERFRQPGDGSLVIENVKADDASEYSCQSKMNTHFFDASVDLAVTELVRIENGQAVKKFQLNEGHGLVCEVKGAQPYVIKWTIQGQKDLPSNVQVKKNDLGSELEIKQAGFVNKGNYTCTVTGDHNSVSHTTQVIIYDGPSFITKPENVTTFEGDPVWVHCSGTGTPKPKLYWFNSDKLYKDLNETRFKQLSNGTLYIPNPKRYDSGKYTCLLRNEVPNKASFRLKVHPAESTGRARDGQPMARTVGIAVGCAGIYIILVIGLMIYCRSRRNKIMKKGINEEGEDGKDPLMANENLQMNTIKNYKQFEFPRNELKPIGNLGYGKMGRVYSAEVLFMNEGGKRTLVAVKELDLKDSETDPRTEFDLEVEMFAQLQHENVACLVGICIEQRPFLIITDYSEMGDLKQYLRSMEKQRDALSVDARTHMCSQIANGMAYLISLRYIHRDLAARNCIAQPNRVKISFLSLCEDTYHNDYHLLHDVPVPLRWLSPEAIQQELYSEKSDIWSFGVVCWEIFSMGEEPYSEMSNEAVLKGVTQSLRLKQPVDCPPSVYNLMMRCWQEDYHRRPEFAEVAHTLNGICFDNNGHPNV